MNLSPRAPHSHLGHTDRTPTGRALWVSSSLNTNGGIATFIGNMRETRLWNDWHIQHIATHCDGSKITRASIFLSGFFRFMFQIVCHRPDLVHLHAAERGSFARKGLLVWCSALFRLPVILHIHSGEFSDFFLRQSPLMREVIRATIERSHTVIALGNAWADVFSRIAPGANIKVIPNGIRLSEPAVQATSDTVQVVFLGKLCELKGVSTLIDAWAATQASGQTAAARLVIAGWGEIERAREQLDQLGIQDSVQLAGPISRSAVRDLLAHTQVLVLPSLYEGQPMSILEAMARGICVVATAVGGIPEMLGTDAGVLVEPGDTAGLAEAIRQVINDRDYRISIGARARQRVALKFDIDIIADQFDSLYRSAVE